jgi:hypothetical protein
MQRAPPEIRVGWVVAPASIATLPACVDWAFGPRDRYRDPNGMPDPAALQDNFRKQKQVGCLKEDLDVKQYADVSMVEDAAKRLG